MCGIFGFISCSTPKQVLVDQTNLLIKRGPDSSGFYFESPIGLGHRRLSVIDLNTGNQPMQCIDGGQVLIFNGEIYNFKQVRIELIGLGCNFTTDSDTEVILQGYRHWGIDKCLEKLEGMFAFAIWDKNLRKLIIARDRFGEKPLYYTHTKNGFFFASELKALKGLYNSKRISNKAINQYFNLTYIPAPLTIFEEVNKLEAGCYLIIDEDLSISKTNYYDLYKTANLNRTEIINDYEFAKKDLRDLLFGAVEERIVSDVPLGSFLSGGIDSSIISAIMAKLSSKPIKTFSIGFNEKEYDESERATLVANHIGSEHYPHVLGQMDLLNAVNETITYFDEPFGDSSAIPSMMVARKAKEQVTVVLTGDCADELFGGYEKYLGKYYAEKYFALPKLVKNLFEHGVNVVPHTNLTNHTLRKIKKVINASSLTPAQRYLSLTSLGFAESERINLLLNKQFCSVEFDTLRFFEQFGDTDELLSTFYSDAKLVLEGDMLAKVDRACMMNSLEGRIPFLDSKIVDFSFRLPHEFKILATNKKRILKDTFSDLLPKETMSFSKKGFGIPLRIWFKYELKNELLSLLNEDFLAEQNIFNPQYVSLLIEEHMSNKENHSTKLWLLFVFQKWYLRNEIEAEVN